MVLLSFPIIIALGSILISTRVGIWLTILSSTILIGFGAIQHTAENKIIRSWKNEPLQINDGIEYAAMLGFTMVISWLSNREIERSLRRARASEAALKEQRDTLEITVEERTKSLKELQLEHASVLNRLAESGKLAAGFFHDLMNPLTALTLAVEKLEAENNSPSPVITEYVSQALKASRRVAGYLNALPGRNESPSENILFSAQTEAKQAIALLEYKARKAGVGLHYEGGPEEIIVSGNPSFFRQIIHNLISNGIEACLGQPSQKQVTVSTTCTLERILIKVADSGKGITGDIRSRVFEPYFSTKEPSAGRGLGLAVAKNLAEQHFRGTLELSSPAGGGTMATLSFPREY